jgi:hypothetical protein
MTTMSSQSRDIGRSVTAAPPEELRPGPENWLQEPHEDTQFPQRVFERVEPTHGADGVVVAAGTTRQT